MPPGSLFAQHRENAETLSRFVYQRPRLGLNHQPGLVDADIAFQFSLAPLLKPNQLRRAVVFAIDDNRRQRRWTQAANQIFQVDFHRSNPLSK